MVGRRFGEAEDGSRTMLTIVTVSVGRGEADPDTGEGSGGSVGVSIGGFPLGAEVGCLVGDAEGAGTIGMIGVPVFVRRMVGPEVDVVGEDVGLPRGIDGGLDGLLTGRLNTTVGASVLLVPAYTPLHTSSNTSKERVAFRVFIVEIFQF